MKDLSKITLPQLRWACRRGMLELDLLLGNFLEKAFPALSERDQHLFIQLLEASDQDLFLWLTGKETSKNQDLNYIVEKIRHYSVNS